MSANRTDLIERLLDELNLPYDDFCVNFIARAWEEDHLESIEEDELFEIDADDVKAYWLDYVTENLFV